MAAQVSESRLIEALAQCVGEVRYPEDDAIITAELPSSALAGLGELLERAREDVKVPFTLELYTCIYAEIASRQASESSAS